MLPGATHSCVVREVGASPTLTRSCNRTASVREPGDSLPPRWTVRSVGPPPSFEGNDRTPVEWGPRRLTPMVHRLLVASVGIAALGLLVPVVAPAGAAPAADPTVTAARSFLVASQQTDGSFELAGFPGFETPDAVLALAEAGVQSAGGDWSSAT